MACICQNMQYLLRYEYLFATVIFLSSMLQNFHYIQIENNCLHKCYRAPKNFQRQFLKNGNFYRIRHVFMCE